MEERQKSLAEFLMKTSFTVLTGLGGLSALLSGLAGGFNLRVPAAVMLLVWISVALLLLSAVFCWRVVSIPSGEARNTLRDEALTWARRFFIAALLVLILSPIGLPVQASLSPPFIAIVSPQKEVDLEYSGVEDKRLTSVPSDQIRFALLVRNVGASLDLSVEVVSPVTTDIATRLSKTEFHLEENDLKAIKCQVVVGVDAEPGSYPLIVRVESGNRIIRSDSLELAVSRAPPAGN